jgi:hypothetical protein
VHELPGDPAEFRRNVLTENQARILHNLMLAIGDARKGGELASYLTIFWEVRALNPGRLFTEQCDPAMLFGSPSMFSCGSSLLASAARGFLNANPAARERSRRRFSSGALTLGRLQLQVLVDPDHVLPAGYVNPVIR